ncbi:Lon protease family protein [Clostridium thermarum]|uniref:Lon protease family protein n=1 Tax=Clostridium thermarum TaxID=1716543 RepID=UPI00111FF6D2|nr:ATP-binding protein [Clostridium thermarum]
MSNFIEIKAEDLRLDISNIPQFESTEEIEPYDKVIGQKRAAESIDLGLNMESKEYNIYISGKTGTGKTGYIVRKIEEHANSMPTPEDWCYVFNFDNPNNPIAISLKPGTALKFKEDMQAFIKFVEKEVPVYFNSENYDNEKNSIVDKYEKMMVALTKELNSKAKKYGFSVKQASTGEFIFIPLKEDKEMTTEDYDELKEEEKEVLEESVTILRNASFDIIKQTRALNKKMEEELKELDDRISESIISGRLEELLAEYGINEKAIKFLTALKNDIIQNIAHFIEDEDHPKNPEAEKLFLRRYAVNVIVSNETTKGAPVIFADSAQPGLLFGNIEYENKLGNLVTDFTLIKSGYLHKANGGFLIIKAQQLLSYWQSWETLKRCINLQAVSIENSKYNIEVLPISTLNPQEIPLKVKIILLGSNLIYSLLLQHDLDFEKLFKIKAEFDSEIEGDEENTHNLIGFFSNYVTNNKLPHISRAGVIKLLQYSSRLVENRRRYSASMSKVLKIVDMASYFAKVDKSPLIQEAHIKKALDENEQMHGLIRKKVLDMYSSKKYVVELKGVREGQINGLSVANYGDCVIGQQHKITVSTYAGRDGIINIEREAEMSGSIHNKGVLILSGYMGQLVGQHIPISFNASIVFEQLYSGIEGDSASAAELIALLSSLSEVPIKQSLAITGSVNQRGEIQPIGGVNDKIEGYFDICSLFGLDGSHGVIIPISNLDELILKDRVVEAVEKGLFHIYAVRTVEDCLQILLPEEFTEKWENNIMEGIKEKIMSKLRAYNEVLRASRL